MKRPEKISIDKWMLAYTKEEMREYAIWHLKNYRVTKRKKVAMLGYLMGLPIEGSASFRYKKWFRTSDPQWYSHKLTFRIGTSE